MEEQTKRFIKRERIRREMMKTKAGETICLQDWQIAILLDWIKELEREVTEHGNQNGKKADRKGTFGGYGRW